MKVEVVPFREIDAGGSCTNRPSGRAQSIQEPFRRRRRECLGVLDRTAVAGVTEWGRFQRVSYAVYRSVAID
jgi:hypothetical protein